MHSKNHISVLLFDLGGVLLELRNAGEHFGLAAHGTEFLEAWVHSGAVRQFESGNAEFDQFTGQVVEELGLAYDSEEFSQRFRSWPVGLYRCVPGMLDRLAVRRRCALLSNTNHIHWGRKDIAGVLEPRLDRLFLSYRTGKLKPDRAAFEQVIAYYDCEPDQILFLDDTPSNIAAASRLGLHTRLVAGQDSLRRAIADFGVD